MNYAAPVSSSITAEVDDATMKLVSALAEKRGMTSEAFAAEAIRRVAESDADFDAFVQVGIDDLDAGRTVPHEVVMAELDTMIAKYEAQCRD